jgi:hypothetical protein
MPDVEDFPPIVQREYRAKVGPGDDAVSRPQGSGLVADGLSRLGILQRIMGRARPPEESDAAESANQDFDANTQDEFAPPEEEGWWDADASTDSDEPTERPNSVPAIFNRLRK